MNEELAAEIKSLQTGKASVQHENSKLKKKIISNSQSGSFEFCLIDIKTM